LGQFFVSGAGDLGHFLVIGAKHAVIEGSAFLASEIVLYGADKASEANQEGGEGKK